MGTFKLLSGGSNSSQLINDTRNPNPLYYKILSVWEYCGWLVVHIKYPNCTNFEGEKILVYKGLTEQELRHKTSIDPHFSEDLKLMARFQPTKIGEKLARLFVVKTVNEMSAKELFNLED